MQAARDISTVNKDNPWEQTGVSALCELRAERSLSALFIKVMGEVMQEQKMLKETLPKVIYHQICECTKGILGSDRSVPSGYTPTSYLH